MVSIGSKVSLKNIKRKHSSHKDDAANSTHLSPHEESDPLALTLGWLKSKGVKDEELANIESSLHRPSPDIVCKLSALEHAVISNIIAENDIKQIALQKGLQCWDFLSTPPSIGPFFHDFPSTAAILSNFTCVLLSGPSKKLFTLGHFDPFVLQASIDPFKAALSECGIKDPYITTVWVSKSLVAECLAKYQESARNLIADITSNEELSLK